MKKITISKNEIQLTINDFLEVIKKYKPTDGLLTFNKNLSQISTEEAKKIKKPKIYVTPEAYLKMNNLVRICEKEIAWHATVTKEKEPGTDNFYYLIEDILVYPQTVEPAFVDTDEAKYADWLMKLPDDIFNKIRCQGHSHVNMAVTPSGTDYNTYNQFLSQLGKNDYYIFMILNKRDNITILLYDLAQNIIFETDDCEYGIVLNKNPLLLIGDWSKEQFKKIEFRDFKPSPIISPYPEGYRENFYPELDEQYKDYLNSDIAKYLKKEKTKKATKKVKKGAKK